MPLNFHPADPNNPYRDFSEQHLINCIQSCPLAESGQYAYSNLGFGLLGHVVSKLSERSYSELCREMVLGPLDMPDSYTSYREIPAAAQSRVAHGHRNQTQLTSRWDFDALSGCGCVLTTCNDLLQLMLSALDAYTNPNVSSEIAVALRYSLEPPWTPIPGNDAAVALGWHVLSARSQSPVFWHNGGTYGFCSYAGFNPQKRRIVVILTNSDTRLDDVGAEVLCSNDAEFLRDDSLLSD